MSTQQKEPLDSRDDSFSFENFPGIKPLMTENELAEHLDCTRNTTAGWRKRGTGPEYIRLPSGEIRYIKVGQWLASRANSASDPFTA